LLERLKQALCVSTFARIGRIHGRQLGRLEQIAGRRDLAIELAIIHVGRGPLAGCGRLGIWRHFLRGDRGGRCLAGPRLRWVGASPGRWKSWPLGGGFAPSPAPWLVGPLGFGSFAAILRDGTCCSSRECQGEGKSDQRGPHHCRLARIHRARTSDRLEPPIEDASLDIARLLGEEVAGRPLLDLLSRECQEGTRERPYTAVPAETRMDTAANPASQTAPMGADVSRGTRTLAAIDVATADTAST
jgi:hypothetical protein